jgi:hypothetical protein
MPLTAALGDELIDATACSDDAWRALHRARPRPTLTCRACSHPMHAKVSTRGLRFFAHDRERANCPAAGETAEHRELKAELATAIRAAGWIADLEAYPAPTDRGGWRADVLATSPSGDRVALEAQLAAMTADIGAARTALYAADAIRTLWVTTKHAPWLWSIPGVRVERAADRLVATRGCLRRPEVGGWEPARVELDRLVATFLAGRVVPHDVGYFTEHVSWGAKERQLWHKDALALVSVGNAERDREQRRREAEAWTKRAADQEAWERNVKALYARQQKLLPWVVEAAAQTGTVWVGAPPRLVSVEPMSAHIDDAAGNPKTAMGAAVWTGGVRFELSLFAVICPVAGRITSSLAASWRSRGVRVFVENEREAGNVARALGWRDGGPELLRGPIVATK